MRLRKPRPKTIVYAILTVAGLIALGIYNSDSAPPELRALSFSRDTLSLSEAEPSLDFAATISDARGVETAELRCLSDGQTKVLSRIVMSGAFAGRVSFGTSGSSYNWVASWDGNRYEFSFAATGIFPPTTSPFECDWHAYLEDELGNQTLINIGRSLSVTE